MEVVGATGETSLTWKRQQVMGKDDFLRLLTTQLQYQDPVNPVDNKEFVAQLAQFTTLEQMQNLSGELKEFISAQMRMSAMGQAASLLGKEVEVATEDSMVTGTVSGLRISASGTPFIVVDGETYELADVVSVKA